MAVRRWRTKIAVRRSRELCLPRFQLSCSAEGAALHPTDHRETMTPRGRQDQSDWPIGCMLDELRLRVLRQIVHEMESRGLWLQRERCAEIIGFRHSYGAYLMQNDLLPAIGADDYAKLSLESIFGLTDHRFERRAPRLLSFGHDIGTGLDRLLATHRRVDSQTGRLCALFNFGI